MDKIIRKPSESSDLYNLFQEGHGGELAFEDIANILAQVPGEADGLDWYWVVELNNGKFAYITGGCDYSGWGCQDWGKTKTADTAIDAAKLAPEKEEYHEETNIQRQLLDQLAGKQPYGLREIK